MSLYDLIYAIIQRVNNALLKTDTNLNEDEKRQFRENIGITGTGADGISPDVSVEDIDGGHRVTITDKDGTKTVDVMDGSDGEDGKTPVKGTDYFTDADKQEIAERAAELVEVPEPDLSGLVKSVNGIAPDENGNVEITIPDSGGDVDLTGYATEQYVQGYAQPKGDYLTAIPDGYAKTEDIPTKPEDIGAQPAGNYALKTDIPSVPVQSVNGKTGAVKLSASDVGARPDSWMPTYTDVGADKSGAAASAVSTHNTNTDAHNDIRLDINAINERLNAFFDSDDKTLDELSEIVAYITSNKALIDSVTTSKVNVSDIINNLTTNVSNKPLSSAQGVVLKGLIDGLSTGKLDANKLQEAINTALAQAKASGEFDGKDGTSVTVKSVSESTEDGGSNMVTFSDGKTVTIKNGSKGSKGDPYTLTDTDKASIVSAVISELPVYAGEVL